MKLLKRILCFMMCVVILSGTVGTKYFDANHMEKVEAASIVIAGGITIATIAEICLFVGTVALAAYGIHEGYENREEIARFGKEFIDSCSETAEGWIMQFVDASGQDYVFGSEALELVRGTEWSVIQGGLPPEGDPNKKDDKDKDKFHIPGDPMTHVVQFTALGATWFSVNAKNIYQDWCDILDGWKGKGTPIPKNNVLANNFPLSFTSYDDIRTLDGGIDVCGHFYGEYEHVGKHFYEYRTYSPYALDKEAYVLYKSNGLNYISYSVESFDGSSVELKYDNYDSYNDAWNYNCHSFNLYPSSRTNCSFSINLPIFTSIEAALAAYESNDFSGALNYAKDYRIADWLQQDWAGELIDPLVNIGLSLSQLIDLMKALGLKTLQGLNAQELLELLKNVLPKLDPVLLPGATPTPIVVDPAVDPIYYPDPDAHPNPPPRPKIDPDPSPKPDPKPDPDPDPGPLPDMDEADYKVDLKSIFPFCIPFDFVALLKVLDAKPRAPCFTIPVVIPALNYRLTIKCQYLK